LLLELVTIQRVITWKQHNQLHLQTNLLTKGSNMRKITRPQSKKTLQNIIPPYLTFCSFLFIFSSFLMLTIQAFFHFPFFCFCLLSLLNQLLFNSCFKPWKNKRRRKKSNCIWCYVFCSFYFYTILYGFTWCLKPYKRMCVLIHDFTLTFILFYMG
jgi:dolichyl-phosphate-mannose--protein O-mannosyl transferase